MPNSETSEQEEGFPLGGLILQPLSTAEQDAFRERALAAASEMLNKVFVEELFVPTALLQALVCTGSPEPTSDALQCRCPNAAPTGCLSVAGEVLGTSNKGI